MAIVEDVDAGYRQIIERVRRLDGLEVSAGILNNAGVSSKGVPLVDIAIYNEFGTRHIPSRPFVRIATDENVDKWAETAARGAKKVIDGGDIKKAGETVGRRMKADIQAVFGDKTRLTPNARSTILRKGRDEPLIDTGKLKSVVNYRVEGA